MSSLEQAGCAPALDGLFGEQGKGMAVAETGRFVGGLHTVAVFKDLEAAKLAVEVLRKKGFAAESISVLAKPSEPLPSWGTTATSRTLETISLPKLGEVLAAGPLIDALDAGPGRLVKAGLAMSMTGVGFQPHDGLIYEALVEKGGVLVAVRNEPRAADAITVFHNYGGGNAAIGAWSGRL
jgi:hypothetical protein